MTDQVKAQTKANLLSKLCCTFVVSTPEEYKCLMGSLTGVDHCALFIVNKLTNKIMKVFLNGIPHEPGTSEWEQELFKHLEDWKIEVIDDYLCTGGRLYVVYGNEKRKDGLYEVGFIDGYSNYKEYEGYFGELIPKKNYWVYQELNKVSLEDIGCEQLLNKVE